MAPQDRQFLVTSGFGCGARSVRYCCITLAKNRNHSNGMNVDAVGHASTFSF